MLCEQRCSWLSSSAMIFVHTLPQFSQLCVELNYRIVISARRQLMLMVSIAPNTLERNRKTSRRKSASFFQKTILMAFCKSKKLWAIRTIDLLFLWLFSNHYFSRVDKIYFFNKVACANDALFQTIVLRRI